MNPGVAAFRPGEVFQLVDESIAYLGQESPTLNLGTNCERYGPCRPFARGGAMFEPRWQWHCRRDAFEDGSTAEHDALIGADGIRSRVRSQLFPEAAPIYRGYMVWRGVSAYRGPAISAGENSETWGHGSRFGILDIGGGKFTWYATANAERRSGVPREWLRERFAGWHEPIPELIESAELILEHGAYDLPALPRWTVGRVTLLGDAAHACTPNLGQGGCMALEDALVLAKCLAGDFATGLHRYEELRRGRTRGIQQRSLWMGAVGQWQSRALVAGRRVVTRLLPAGGSSGICGGCMRMRLDLLEVRAKLKVLWP